MSEEPQVKKFRIKGTIEITYKWLVDEEIEAENEDEAYEFVIEDLDPITSFDSDADTYNCECDEVDESGASREAERAAELLKLQQWNAWARGQAVSQ